MSKKLCIFLFGGLTIEENKLTIAPMLRKNEALFVYLACHPQSIHRREALATLLWGEKEALRSAGNFRTALNALQSKLGDYLEVTRQTIAINRATEIWVDALVFDDLAQRALRTSPSGLLNEFELNALSEAVNLYRGEFLYGFSLRDSEAFDQWVRAQSGHYHLTVTQALHKLVTHYLAAEDYQAGIAWGRRLTELDPLNEGACRDMMRLLSNSGQTTAALQEYEALRRLLEKEELKPDDETIALHEALVHSSRRAVGYSTTGHLPSAPAVQNKGEFPHGAQPNSPLPNNLALPLTPIIDRQDELRRLVERVGDERCRLMTLTGPGGVGKTRLAIEAGLMLLTHPVIDQKFSDGIYFVNLQSIDQPNLVANVIANALGCQMQGVVDPERQLIAYLRPRRLLLILDNFEHLLAASELVFNILQAAKLVKVLTTSLEPLNFQGEWLLQVAGLPYPINANEEDWAEYPAIQLFARSAEQVMNDFDVAANREAITAICHQVQGLPLGIQLAASITRAFSCQRIAAELGNNIDFLSTTMRNVPQRHRSLRAIFNYVWGLMDERDRKRLPKLAVFEDSFGDIAAERVAGIDAVGLMELLDRSLLQRATDMGGVSTSNENKHTQVNNRQEHYKDRYTDRFTDRYRIHRALHGYLLEKLADSGELFEQVRRQHCDYYMSFLQSLRPMLYGPEMGQALARLDQELANWRSAWRYAAATQALDRLEAGYESIAQFYVRRGPFTEGIEILQRGLESVRKSQKFPTSDSRRCKSLLAHLLLELARFYNEAALYLDALETADEVEGLAVELADVALEAMTYLNRGRTYYHMGTYERARQNLERADTLAVSAELHRIKVQVDLYLGNVYAMQNRITESRELLLAGLERCHRDSDPTLELSFYQGLARNAFFSGDYSEATMLFEKVLSGLKTLGNYARMGVMRLNLGAVHHQVGEYKQAREEYNHALEIFRATGDMRSQELVLANLALLGHHMGDQEQALHHGQRALAIAQERKDRDNQAYASTVLGHIYHTLGNIGEATRMYEQGLTLRRELEQPGPQLEPMAGLARLALERGDNAEALVLVESICKSVQQTLPTGVVEMLRLLGTCYEVLLANCDTRVLNVVKLGVEIVVERAAKIAKMPQRKSFVEQVVANRRMLDLAKEYSIEVPVWLKAF